MGVLNVNQDRRLQSPSLPLRRYRTPKTSHPLDTLPMATEDELALLPIDIQDPETAGAFISFLEPFLPFSCGLIGLTQSYLTPQPDPCLKAWATFDFSNSRSTSEVPKLFTVAVFTPIQGRLFCSADTSPEDVTAEELIHRKRVVRLYVVTATSLIQTLPGHEEDSEYLLGVVHEKFFPLVKPYAGDAPTPPYRLFFCPPPDTEVIKTTVTGPDTSRWLVTGLEESDLELVRSTSHFSERSSTSGHGYPHPRVFGTPTVRMEGDPWRG